MPMKNPPHPGRSILRDCMEPLGMTLEDTARQLAISPRELQSVIDGEAGITFALAVRLDRLFGCGASTWYQLQAAYDEAQDRQANASEVGMGSRLVHQQTATIPFEHGRVVYTTYDADVIALGEAPSSNPDLADDPNHNQVDFRFVGEGAGAVQIQMIYQPSVGVAPRSVAEALFPTYIEWDEIREEYVAHINAEEWNRESQKLYDGKEIMNALYGGLKADSSMPILEKEDIADESDKQHKVLMKAGELLYKGTDTVHKITDIVSKFVGWS